MRLISQVVGPALGERRASWLAPAGLSAAPATIIVTVMTMIVIAFVVLFLVAALFVGVAPPMPTAIVVPIAITIGEGHIAEIQRDGCSVAVSCIGGTGGENGGARQAKCNDYRFYDTSHFLVPCCR